MYVQVFPKQLFIDPVGAPGVYVAPAPVSGKGRRLMAMTVEHGVKSATLKASKKIKVREY